jgi:hypothetical protein
MGEIGPYLSPKELCDSANSTMNGDGLKHPLPGVAADAWKMDRTAYETNRELARKIRVLVQDAKNKGLDKPRFILAWRMYANAEDEYWRQAAGQHQCGCTCGCCSTS